MAEADNPFASLAADIKDKVESDQRKALDCMTIMNDIVRPALRDAKAAINPRHPRIFWKDSDRPSVRVEGTYQNDLSFACNGRILEVTSTQGGGGASHSWPIEEVSRPLIVKEIEDFLRQALEV